MPRKQKDETKDQTTQSAVDSAKSTKGYRDPLGELKYRKAFGEPRKIPSPIGMKQVDWSHWNRMPVVSKHEAILLTLDLDPGSYFSGSIYPSRYHELSSLVDSHVANFSLSYHDAAKNTFRSADWHNWLDNVDIDAPKSWRRSDGVDSTETELPETRNSSVGRRRREQYIDAAIDMLPTKPTGQVEVLNFIREARENNQAAYRDINILDDQSILRSIRKAALEDEPSNPLKDPHYLRAIDIADQ